MEVVGLVVGVASLASLYRTCLDAVDRVDAYRKYEAESKELWSLFDANKVIFRDWAGRVGLSSEGLQDPHDSRLDDEEMAKAVCGVLYVIQSILDKADHLSPRDSKGKQGARSFLSKQVDPKTLATDATQSSRRRDKFLWSIHDKGILTEQVEKFGECIGKLVLLLPDQGNTQRQEVLQIFRSLNIQGESSLGVAGVLAQLDLIQIANAENAQRAAEHRNAFRRWLGPVQPSDRYEGCRACRTQSTCRWLLEKDAFVSWGALDFPHNVGKILWLHGPAGFGKSVLCASLVELLKDQLELCVCHYFYDSMQQDQDTSSSILRSWISQLVNETPVLLSVAQDFVEDEFSLAGQRSLWKLFSRLLENADRCVFVVDGLDECGTARSMASANELLSRSHFLTQLLDVAQSHSSHFLIVSRSEPDIKNVLSTKGQTSKNSCLYEYEISTADVEADVLAFSHSVVAAKLANKKESFKTKIAQTMAQKCEGMFLWVDLQQRHLRGGKNERQLQQRVQDMPPGLESIYERSWAHIMKLSDSERSRALKILRWATFALSPLTVGAMTEALIVPDEDEECDDLLDDLPDGIDQEYLNDEILALCGSLIAVRAAQPDQPLTAQTVSLRHFSVREFLLSSRKSEVISNTQSVTGIEHKLHHRFVAISCLRYLERRLTSVLGDSEADPSFAKYSVLNFSQHARSAGNCFQNLNEILRGFFVATNTCWQAWIAEFERLNGRDAPKIPMEIRDQERIANPLYYAALLGLEDTAENLGSFHPELLNEPGKWGTPLQAASFTGCDRIAKHLIQLGADVNDDDNGLRTALVGAISSNSLELCQYLLSEGADVNMATNCNATVLYYSSIVPDQGSPWLLSEEMDSTSQKTSPLLFACLNGRSAIVRLLLDRGANSDAFQNGWTPLHAASYAGAAEIVECLLDRGDQSVAENFGWTPLHLACRGGHTDIVRLILERHGPLTRDRRSAHGQTPLALASYFGTIDCVQLLLNSNADLSIPTEKKWTPLLTACEQGHANVVALLLAEGADLSTPEKDGFSPLFMACYNGHSKIVDLLLENGADPSYLTNPGTAPLYVACKRRDHAIMKSLIHHGADLSTSFNDDEWSPLHHAVFLGDIEATKLLLQNHADSSLATGRSETSLHLAARNDTLETLEIMELLLASGADPLRMDDYGRTPLDWAAMYESFSQAIHKWKLQYKTRLAEDSERILKNTIKGVTHQILVGNSFSASFLGHCFLFRGDDMNAQHAFEYDTEVVEGEVHHPAACDNCDEHPIRGFRYICKSCADTDLCEPCFQLLPESGKPLRCRRHEFLQFPCGEDDFARGTLKQQLETLKAWARNLTEQNSYET